MDNVDWVNSDIFVATYAMKAEDNNPTYYGYGWMCPRCRRIWAPFIPCCSCNDPKLILSSSTNEDDDRK